MRPKPVYDGYTLKLPNAAGELEDVGCITCPSNAGRLVELKAFLYKDDEGLVSVRLERKQRGSTCGYWVAYKRRNGKLHKAYVCEAYLLDPYNLDIAAARVLIDGYWIGPRPNTWLNLRLP